MAAETPVQRVAEALTLLDRALVQVELARKSTMVTHHRVGDAFVDAVRCIKDGRGATATLVQVLTSS